MAENARGEAAAVNPEYPRGNTFSQEGVSPVGNLSLPGTGARGKLPPREHPSNRRLVHSAEAVGRRVGTTVHDARRIPRGFQSRLHVASERARGNASALAHRLERKMEQVRSRAWCALGEARGTASAGLKEARRQAQSWQRKNPAQVLLAAAGAALLAGMALRTWRSRRD